MQTYILNLTGTIQGVGFRPFVYKIATKYFLKGYVLNNNQGVKILIQGNQESIQNFLKELKNPPSAAKITSITQKKIPNKKIFSNFEIQKSQTHSIKTATIPADLALCQECINELFNPKDRRFLYPFISCTNCGGRYSLIHSLPYDRQNTAMANFKMCKICQQEYTNSNSRRFHSEINCCPNCGPQVFFTTHLNYNDKPLLDSQIIPFLKTTPNPIKNAIAALKNGKILALKGIGGYALICDATNQESIQILRDRKNRPKKPFAIMCKDLKMAMSFASLNKKEKDLLTSQIAPIVLSYAKTKTKLPLHLIAPNLATLGIILPYAPLHYLIFNEIEFPLIFTSANISGEPIIKDFYTITQKLQGICDGVLLYNRDIFNPIDDSLIRILNKKTQILRRARGYLSDIPFSTPHTQKNFIALGAQQKSTFCLKFHNKLLLSPHLGDLNNLESFLNFKQNLNLFTQQYQAKIDTFCADLHPNYAYKELLPSKNTHFIQHHFAHLLSNIAENRISSEVLGVIFDGTGYGLDGNIWGGEFLFYNPKKPLTFQRIASFAPFYLLGGEVAIKDIRRLGIEALFVAFKEHYKTLKLPLLESLKKDYGKDILTFFYKQHQNTQNYTCNSVGRIFDMVASLCNLTQKTSYEGEGGMLLESLAYKAQKNKIQAISYSFAIKKNIILWDTMMQEIYYDLQNHIPIENIALNFHFTLANIIKHIANQYETIALSGGCFQNAVLTQLTLQILKNKKVFLNQEIPCNDGGISFGQAYYMQLKTSKESC